MGFLQPFVLFGLAAVAVPPLLHLLARRMPPVVPFPALRYLMATEREHSRRLKLRNLLLMMLRMVIIALIVLAAARPVADVGAGGEHPPTAVALVVDNSLSSGAVESGRTILDRLRDQARRILDDLAPGDELWLVTADGQPRRLGRVEATAVLDTLTPAPLRLDLTDAVRQASTVVEQSSLDAREILVLSDLQATAFTTGEVIPTPSLWLAAGSVPMNRGVDSAFAEPAQWFPGGDVVVGVSGDGVAAAAVRLSVDEVLLGRAVAAPGERVVLHGSLPRLGWHAAVLELDPDELLADDRWWLALRSARPAGVEVDPAVGEFVQDAIEVLTAGGRVRQGMDVVLADEVTAQVTVVFPPDDPATLGSLNRALLARGISAGFGPRESGEWVIESDLAGIAGVAVRQRHRITGGPPPLATAGGAPWIVRDENVVLVGSRMEEGWTALPVSAGFLPFLDLLVNRVAAAEASVVRAHPGEMVAVPPVAASLLVADRTISAPPDRRMPAPNQTGVHFFVDVVGDTVGALEVNHDPRESRLTPANASLVRATVGDGARVVEERVLLRDAFGATRRAELSGVLLVAAILAALTELALATMGSRGATD